MKATPKIYGQALFEAMVALPTNQHKKVINNFLKELVKKGNFKLLDKISAEYERCIDEAAGTQLVEVTSAMPLDEKTKTEIKDKLKKSLGVKKVNLNETVDPTLLSGLTLSWNDQFIDGSLRSRLDQLKKHLAR